VITKLVTLIVILILILIVIVIVINIKFNNIYFIKAITISIIITNYSFRCSF